MMYDNCRGLFNKSCSYCRLSIRAIEAGRKRNIISCIAFAPLADYIIQNAEQGLRICIVCRAIVKRKSSYCRFLIEKITLLGDMMVKGADLLINPLLHIADEDEEDMNISIEKHLKHQGD